MGATTEVTDATRTSKRQSRPETMSMSMSWSAMIRHTSIRKKHGGLSSNTPQKTRRRSRPSPQRRHSRRRSQKQAKRAKKRFRHMEEDARGLSIQGRNLRAKHGEEDAAVFPRLGRLAVVQLFRGKLTGEISRGWLRGRTFEQRRML